MRKLLTIILCMFLSANNFVYAADENVNSIDKNVESLKDALNGALDLPSKTPLFIVKVRRRVGDKEVQTPLISHSECEQLLRLLYSLCSKQDAPKYSDGGVAFNKKFNTSAKEDELAKVDELCRELAAYRAKINGACTLVVFNEALFSQDPPLTTNQKNFILEQLKLLSSSAPNTVFYPNFLFTEMRGNTREQAKEA
ncbi:MAG: hypothetical protein LBJ71_03485, partial [Holosporaceae bacterium]|nr:hypothetical protein [Holosporaceae bacterium]